MTEVIVEINMIWWCTMQPLISGYWELELCQCGTGKILDGLMDGWMDKTHGW